MIMQRDKARIDQHAWALENARTGGVELRAASEEVGNSQARIFYE